jgi:ketosteroid isomerase-like protein
MNQSIESKNKALVLEAFDTLFNKRDYAAAERYWSPNYNWRNLTMEQLWSKTVPKQRKQGQKKVLHRLRER